MEEGHGILVGFFVVYETFIKLLEDAALSGLGKSKNLRVLLGNITCNLFTLNAFYGTAQDRCMTRFQHPQTWGMK